MRTATKTKALVASLLTACGCASVQVQKIPNVADYDLVDCPTNTQSEACRNGLQRRADSIKGVRYYLPRPYVAVKQAFPVYGATYFVQGRLDGQNRVIEMIRGDAALPDDLAAMFPIAMGDVQDMRGRAPVSGQTGLAQQSETTPPATADAADPDATEAPATTPTVKLVADSAKHLKGTTVSEASVSSKDVYVQIQVAVSEKAANALEPAGGSAVLQRRVYLVPFTAGTHDAKNVVKLEAAGELLSFDLDADTGKAVIRAQIKGEKVPALASVGVGFLVTPPKEGDEEPKAEEHVLHGSQVDITNSFAGAGDGDGSSDGPDDEDKEPGTSSQEEKKQVSKAKATVSGDPTTSPLIKVGPLYDVLLLPDYSEQYAIRTRSGVFKASADIGLENGWMAERINTEIDNSSLGDFLVDTAGKVVDLAAAAAAPAAAAVDAAAQAPTLGMEQQSLEELVASVLLLRVDLVDSAVPGLHPLLKPSEQWCGPQFSAGTPCPPRVQYETRREVMVSLVDLSGGPSLVPTRAAGSEPKRPAPPSPKPIEGEELTADPNDGVLDADERRAVERVFRDNPTLVVKDAQYLPLGPTPTLLIGTCVKPETVVGASRDEKQAQLTAAAPEGAARLALAKLLRAPAIRALRAKASGEWPDDLVVRLNGLLTLCEA